MDSTVSISLRDPEVASVFAESEPGDTITVTLEVMVQAKDAKRLTASVVSVVSEEEEPEGMEMESEEVAEEVPPAPAPTKPVV